MTQQQIADLIGVSRVAYTRYESGERKPSPEVAKKIGQILGFPWTRFFE